MSISINGHILDDDLALEGYTGRSFHAESVRFLLDGGVVGQSIRTNGGQEITLAANSNGQVIEGEYSKADIDYFNTLRASRSAAILVHHDNATLLVRVTGVDVVPQMGEVNPGADSYYTGTLTMRIIQEL